LVDISVIIVNYNVKDLLEQCINSIISASKNLTTEIIIVDNNSFDGSVEMLENKFSSVSSVKVIGSPVNLGFAKANNLGAKEAKGEYLLILNPDTILQEDTLDKTLEFYRSNSGIGALTCKLILPSGKLDLACRRSFPTPSVAVYRILGLSRIFSKSRTFGKYNLTYLNEDESYEVDAIVGAFMFIRKSIYDSLKGFDEDYFMYGEDLDLCYRIKQAGYRNYYYHGTSIIHYKGESTKKSSISYVNNFYGAMQIFVRKNLHTRFRLMDILIKFSIAYRALLSYIKRIVYTYYPALLDLLFIIIGMILAIYLRFEFFPLEAYSVVIFVYTAVWMLTLVISGSYSDESRFSLVKPFYGILIGFFINSSFTYFFNEYAFSRAVVLRTVFNAYVFIAGWRVIAKIINYSKSKSIFRSNKTLIIGKNDDTERFISKLKTRVDSEYDFTGYISPDTTHGPGYSGNLNNLKDIVASNKIKNIIFAKNELTNQLILDLMWNLKNYNVSFKILSEDNELILGKSPLDKIDDIYLIQIEYNINRKINIFVKRFMDILIASASLFTLYPAAMIVKAVLKPDERSSKFLNKVKLIPSVITGEYSMVGRATWDTTSHGKKFLGKKGLTGLVQINFYKNLSSDEIEYFNYYYAKNQSLTLDIEILLKTISLFLFKKNIPEL
jgi:GT2 family glycosyltransferase/lipopolysaccharide/colanic/teichoic acid biosynthesis glycosyltransferase